MKRANQLTGIKSYCQNYFFNPLMLNVREWSETLYKSCSKCCKIFKVCLTILGHYALKG